MWSCSSLCSRTAFSGFLSGDVPLGRFLELFSRNCSQEFARRTISYENWTIWIVTRSLRHQRPIMLRQRRSLIRAVSQASSHPPWTA